MRCVREVLKIKSLRPHAENSQYLLYLSLYIALPVPAGQIVTERDPAHGAGFEIWVGLAGITDDMAFSALVDLLRRPGYLQADRTLQETVGGARQSSDRRKVG